MKNFDDEFCKIIRELRLMLIEKFNSYSSNKIISDGNQSINLFEYCNSDELTDNPKMELVVGFILEIEGFEEASEELPDKERIKLLKELSKKIRKSVQEV